MGVGGGAAQGRRIEPKKVVDGFAPSRIVVAEHRRLVEPESLNEESGVRDDTPAVGRRPTMRSNALSRFGVAPAIGGNVPLGSPRRAEIGQRLVAQAPRAAASPAPARRRRRRSARRSRRRRCTSAAAARSVVSATRDGALRAARAGRETAASRRCRPGATRASRSVGEQAASDNTAASAASCAGRSPCCSSRCRIGSIIPARSSTIDAMSDAARRPPPPRRWLWPACACSTCRASSPARGARRRWPISAPT